MALNLGWLLSDCAACVYPLFVVAGAVALHLEIRHIVLADIQLQETADNLEEVAGMEGLEREARSVGKHLKNQSDKFPGVEGQDIAVHAYSIGR